MLGNGVRLNGEPQAFDGGIDLAVGSGRHEVVVRPH